MTTLATLATLAATGILALATAAAIVVAMGRAAEHLDHLTPDGYEPAPGGDERGPIVVNRREPE